MKIKEICIQQLKNKGIIDEKYLKRLEWELKEVENQDKENYFLDLFEYRKILRMDLFLRLLFDYTCHSVSILIV